MSTERQGPKDRRINCAIHGPNSLATVSVDGETAILICQENVYYCPVDKSHVLEGAARIFDPGDVYNEDLQWKIWCEGCNTNVTPQSKMCAYTDKVRIPYPD